MLVGGLRESVERTGRGREKEREKQSYRQKQRRHRTGTAAATEEGTYILTHIFYILFYLFTAHTYSQVDTLPLKTHVLTHFDTHIYTC